MGIRALLFKSPEWNFIQEIASSPLNGHIQVEICNVQKDVPLDLFKIHRERHIQGFVSLSYVEKGPPKTIYVNGNQCETFFTPVESTTPFYLINDIFVASVKNLHPPQEKSRFKQLNPDEERPITELEQPAAVDSKFNRLLKENISDWNTMFQRQLSIIFVTCVSAFAMNMTMANFACKCSFSVAKSLSPLFLITAVAFAAFSILTVVRLVQFYSVQKYNKSIGNLGQWVGVLWHCVQDNPTLLHGDLYRIFSSIRCSSSSKDGVGIEERRRLFVNAAERRRAPVSDSSRILLA